MQGANLNFYGSCTVLHLNMKLLKTVGGVGGGGGGHEVPTLTTWEAATQSSQSGFGSGSTLLFNLLTYIPVKPLLAHKPQCVIGHQPGFHHHGYHNVP